MLVGEQHVDVGFDEVEEIVAVAVDAEGVRRASTPPGAPACAGDFAAYGTPASPRRVPQVALEVDDARPSDRRRVDVGRGKTRGGADVGVHRPLRIGGDEDQAAAVGGPWGNGGVS